MQPRAQRAAQDEHVDLFLLDLYGGPFASVFLGEKVRLYAAGGPLGLELPSGTWIGAGVRLSDSEVDVGTAGDLDLAGFRMLITVSRFD